jgi:hypothetical protein
MPYLYTFLKDMLSATPMHTTFLIAILTERNYVTLLSQNRFNNARLYAWVRSLVRC